MARKSAVQKFRQLLSSLEESREPAYLLHGEEMYLQDKFLQTMNDVFEHFYQSQWNKYTYHASDISSEVILSELTGVSLFSEPRLVIIKELSELDESGRSALLQYLENPQEETCLVLLSETPRLSSKFLKKVKALSLPVEVRIPWMREMDEWLQEMLRNRNMEASPEIRSVLIETAGETLQHLANELEKIRAAYSSEKVVLTREILEKHVGQSRTHSTFELKDILGTKSLHQILGYVFSLLEEGASVSYILMTVANYYEELWLIKEMLGEQKPDKEINRVVFGGRNLAWKYKKVVNKFSRDELLRAFPLLEEADLITKTTSNLDAKNYLTAFFHEMLTSQGGLIHE